MRFNLDASNTNDNMLMVVVVVIWVKVMVMNGNYFGGCHDGNDIP